MITLEQIQDLKHMVLEKRSLDFNFNPLVQNISTIELDIDFVMDLANTLEYYLKSSKEQ